MISKKWILYLFHSVFVFLVICTFFSGSIERQMTAHGLSVRAGGPAGDQLPMDILMQDDGGIHLFYAEEGSGWEYGIRVHEMNPDSYWIGENQVTIHDGYDYTYIHYTSKPIQDGDLIHLTEINAKDAEDYLIISQVDGIQFDETESMRVLEQKNSSWLIFAANEKPFMENRVKSDLRLYQNVRIYSLAEIRQFFGNFVLLSFGFVLLLWTVFLEIGIGRKLYRKDLGNSLMIESIRILLMLILLAILSNMVHLPSSLLPLENIFDIRYYLNEICNIYALLNKFQDSVVRRLIFYINSQVLISCGIILAGIIMMLEKKRWYSAIVRIMTARKKG